MHSSGKEETGVVVGRHSCNCFADVPFKKRKFPLVRPPSPPPQEPPCLPLEENRRSSSPSRESSPSTADDGTVSIENCDASKNLILEIKNEIPADTNDSLVRFDVNLSTSKPQAPSTSIPSDELDHSSLSLSQNKFTDGCEGDDVKVNSDSTHVSANRSNWDLNATTDSLNSDSTHVRANRSNWDLNATMDSWETFVGDSGDGPDIVGVSDVKNFFHTHGVEPSINSTAVLGVVSDAEEQIPEDFLELSMSTFGSPNFSGEENISSAKVCSGRVLPDPKLVETLVSTGNTSFVGCNTIKSEPFDENIKHDSFGARGNPMGLSDLVNRGSVDRYSKKAVNSLDVIPEKVVESRPIMSEAAIHSGRIEDVNGDDPERCMLEAMVYVPMDSRRNGEGSESDEEKINISTDILKQHSCKSDYVPDGDHDVITTMNSEGRYDDREDDEYEDGEVRAVTMEDREEGKIMCGDCDGKTSEALDFRGAGNTARALDENVGKVEDHNEEISDDRIEETVMAVFSKEVERVIDKDCSLQESSTVAEVAARADEMGPIKATERRPLDLSEELSDGTTSTSITNANIKGTDTVEIADPALLKTESFLNDKDTSNGGSRSRIINLARASNVTSPCKPRFIPDRPLLSTTRRERHTDFEEEKVVLRRNRGDFYADCPRRFERDRSQDQPFRNSRGNFMHGGGRYFRQRGERDCDRDFGAGIYNGPGDYRFSRHKRASTGVDAEVEDNDGMAPNRALRISRGGKKSMTDEFPSFHHPSRVIQTVRRFAGDESPSRFSEDGFTRGEKFTNQILDGPFAQVNRNFPTVQRRGLPRIRSKSPVRCRSRYLGPWSSHRRSSPDRVLRRSTRRVDTADHRERIDKGKYLRGPIRSGRSQDGREDKRRRCGDRPCSFRPCFNGQNLHYSPGPLRFCPEPDSDLIERGQFREREFDSRNTNLPGIGRSRIRSSLELEEGNYRHGGKVWHDDGVEDVSEMKRRRF